MVYTPRGKYDTPRSLPQLLAACKVLVKGMQILENYACRQGCSLHDTSTSCCLCCMLHAHTPWVYFYEIFKFVKDVISFYSLRIKAEFTLVMFSMISLTIMPAILRYTNLPWPSYHPRWPRQVQSCVAVADSFSNKCRQRKWSIKLSFHWRKSMR